MSSHKIFKADMIQLKLKDKSIELEISILASQQLVKQKNNGKPTEIYLLLN